MKFLRNTLENGINSKQTKNSSGQRPEGSCLAFFLGQREEKGLHVWLIVPNQALGVNENE